MPHPRITLDIVHHLESEHSLTDDSARYQLAAEWVAKRACLASLTASIAVVDDATIQQVNREQLGHDWVTDVISFVFESVQRPDGCHIDGEIMASADTARRLSVAAEWKPEDELLLYILHGLLHLAGWDDIKPEDQAAMRAAEHECLLALNVPGASEHLSRWEHVSHGTSGDERSLSP